MHDLRKQPYKSNLPTYGASYLKQVTEMYRSEQISLTDTESPTKEETVEILKKALEPFKKK